jgi:hypothetical protein
MLGSMHCILHSLIYCIDRALHLYLELYHHISLVSVREFSAGFYEDNRKSTLAAAFLVVSNLSMRTSLFFLTC